MHTPAAATPPAATTAAHGDGLARIGHLLDQLTGLAADLTAATRTTRADHDGDGDGGGGRRVTYAVELLAAVDRVTAAAVQLLADASRSGVIAEHGLTPASYVRAVGSHTTSDERMLTATADRLSDMPVVAGWFADGTLSWSTVRGIVAAVRPLTGPQRRWIDTALGVDAERVAGLDADQVVAAVASLADTARDDLVVDREDRQRAARRFVVHHALDGTATGYVQFDREGAAILDTALASYRHHTRRHRRDSQPTERSDGDSDHSDGDSGDSGHGHAGGGGAGDGGHGGHRQGDGGCGWESQQRRDTSNYDALIAMLTHRTTTTAAASTTDTAADTHADTAADAHGVDAGGGGQTVAAGGVASWAPRVGTPTMLITADVAHLTDGADNDGDTTVVRTRRRGSRGGLAVPVAAWLRDRTAGRVEMTAATASRLSCDATLQVVFTDGDEIVGISAAEPAVSAGLRRLLYARDGGCRFPGCDTGVALCDLHHIRWRIHGGPTRDDNLAVLCRAHHHAIHDGGWTLRRVDDAATMVFTRRGHTLTSHPRTRQRLTPTTAPPPGRPRRRAAHRHPPPPDGPDRPAGPAPPSGGSPPLADEVLLPF